MRLYVNESRIIVSEFFLQLLVLTLLTLATLRGGRIVRREAAGAMVELGMPGRPLPFLPFQNPR
jgi:hypothetical protein